MSLTNAFWVRAGDGLGIQAKLDTGEWRLIKPSIRPYFFVRARDLPRAKELLSKAEAEVDRGDYVDVKKEPCVKVEVTFPSQVSELRDKLEKMGIKSYEADIKFVKRWMVDLDIRASPKPRIIYFDVEMDGREGLPSPDNPSARIISISCVNRNGDEYFISDDDEVKIFHEFQKILHDYDLAIGYNNLRYDNPYLEARARMLGISYNPRVIQWQDLMLLYNKSWGGGFVSLKLDDVAKREVGLGKRPMPEGFRGAGGLWRAFKERQDLLREYNLTDARLLKLIDEKLNIVDTCVDMASISYNLYEDTLYNSRLIDGLLLRKSLMRSPRVVWGCRFGPGYEFGSHARGELDKSDKVKYEHYTGGLVIDPIPGLHHNVINLDFASMYPRIIRTFNVGIDTADDNGEILTEVKRFHVKPRSLFAEFLEELDKLRSEHKAKMKVIPRDSPEYTQHHVRQINLKYLLNATYGVIGSYGLRYYDKDVAESVTATGRSLLSKVGEICNKMGFTTIYMDTDGIFIWKSNLTADKILSSIDVVVEEVNDQLREWVIEKYGVPKDYYCLQVDFETVYTKIFFGREKKRYIAETFEPIEEKVLGDYVGTDIMIKENRKIVGYEIKRLDVPEIVKRVQKKIFDIIFAHETMEEIRAETRKYLRTVRDLLYSGELDNELVIEKGTKRRLEWYKSRDVHIRAAEELAKRGLFRPGDPVAFVISEVKNGKMIGCPVHEELEFPKIYRSGYNYYYNQRILPMVKKILGEDVDPTVETLNQWL
jgi:DNA polymerase I